MGWVDSHVQSRVTGGPPAIYLQVCQYIPALLEGRIHSQPLSQKAKFCIEFIFIEDGHLVTSSATRTLSNQKKVSTVA